MIKFKEVIQYKISKILTHNFQQHKLKQGEQLVAKMPAI